MSIGGRGERGIDHAAARARLLAWYRRRKRDLPWRRTKDPYAVWISEIMLQQTRVMAVLPYYERFLRRFPDAGALARARLDTVLACWSGLGYYRRARHLHAAARTVVRSGFPTTAAGWRELPGVGPYTAAAVASIVYGERVAVVDGNVERVICRLHARRSRDRKAVRAIAERWCSPRAPGSHNQAVMELGAIVCTPRAPDCGRCPLKGDCRGRERPLDFPAPIQRTPDAVERLSFCFATREGRVFLRRRESPGLLQGMWELPLQTGKGRPLAVVRHGILDRRQELAVFAGRPSGKGRWFSPRQVAGLALAAGARKCLLKVGFLD